MDDRLGQPRLGLEDVRRIVGAVAFMDRKFRVMERAGGFLLQLEYYEEDVDHPERGPQLQRARKWYVSPFSTETEIVETAFKACRVSMDHVLKEHFTYRGRRVYSPHFKISARIEMCDRCRFDARVPIGHVR